MGKLNSRIWLVSALFSLVILPAMSAVAGEYLLTGARPDKLILIDTETGELVRTYTVPGQTTGSWSIVVAPDNRTVYVTGKQHQSLIGLDLDSGDVVFQANLSGAGERVRAHYGLDVSADGEEVYVYVNRAKLKIDEYQVLDNQVLVFDTGAGLDARPSRRLPAPRRVFSMALTDDDASLFLASWDFQQIDTQTGEVLKTHPINSWDIDNRTPGNAYGHWVSSEQSGIFTMPVFSVHTDRDPYAVEAYQYSIAQIDTKTGEFTVWDSEYAANLIFSMVTSPTRPEVYATYNTLARIDSANKKTLQRVPLEATYYTVNISADGNTVFLAGGGCKVAAHRASDLSRIWGIELPGCIDQSFSYLRVVDRGPAKM